MIMCHPFFRHNILPLTLYIKASCVPEGRGYSVGGGFLNMDNYIERSYVTKNDAFKLVIAMLVN